LALAIALCAPLTAHAQADSVSAGKFRGGWKDMPIKRILERVPNARYLLENVWLTTNARDPDGTYTYGPPFKNDSPYALTLVLNHQGGNKNRHHYIWVDNIMVGKSVNIDTAAPVIVQPGSTYKWEVKDSYRITAWILTDEVGVNLRAITQKSGLPYQENFANPTRLLGTYLGCIAYYTDNYTYTNGEWIFAASQLDSVISYYEALNMTDGSISDQNTEYVEEFGAYVAKGAAVKSAVACFERRTKSTPTTEKDNSGGL
jgi:hypothetical protein